VGNSVKTIMKSQFSKPLLSRSIDTTKKEENAKSSKELVDRFSFQVAKESPFLMVEGTLMHDQDRLWIESDALKVTGKVSYACIVSGLEKDSSKYRGT
jgi:hypothetical protein